MEIQLIEILRRWRKCEKPNLTPRRPSWKDLRTYDRYKLDTSWAMWMYIILQLHIIDIVKVKRLSFQDEWRYLEIGGTILNSPEYPK